jgi:AraC family transcriptional regulator
MSKTQPLTVDFTQENTVSPILPCPFRRSSKNLGWQNIYIQQHQQPAWETPEFRQRKHVLLVHTSRDRIQSERMFDGRRQREELGGGNNTVIIPAMVEHQANWNKGRHFSLLFLDPHQLTQVAYEAIANHPVELIPHYAMSDPFIEQIERSLSLEMESNSFASQLFVDSLTTALSIHLLRHYSTWQRPLREASGGLPSRQLQQAIEYIQAHLNEEIKLASIAAQLGMSQYYFARLFKQSMHISPYQYVIQQRIDRVKHLLKTTSMSISEIAYQTGFSHQSQLTNQFRKTVGTTPINYRKQQ